MKKKSRYGARNGNSGASDGVEGRLDVLLTEAMKIATNALDGKLGLTGTWDRVGDAVQMVVSEHVPQKPVRIPNEARVLAKLMGIG